MIRLNPTLVNDFEVFVSQKVEKISDYIKSSYIEFASRKNECNLRENDTIQTHSKIIKNQA